MGRHRSPIVKLQTARLNVSSDGKKCHVQLLAAAQEWFVDLPDTLCPSDNPTDKNHTDLNPATVEATPHPAGC
jgi:hypothetical protein